MSDNRNDQNRNNQHQGQDKSRDKQQPGQAGGDKMPGKNKSQIEDRDTQNQESELENER